MPAALTLWRRLCLIALQRWASRFRHALSLHVLFATDGDVNTFRDIRTNIDFVADVCVAAEACVRSELLIF